MDILIPFIAGLIAAGSIWLIAHLLDKKKGKKQIVRLEKVEIHYED